MNPELTTQYRRHDPDGTRRRHTFWRNVIGPQVVCDWPAERLRRCLDPGPVLGD